MGFRIAGETVPQGSSRWINLEFTEDADSRSLDVPAYVINGGDGPTLWYQGCVHGDEHTGSIALRDFVTALDPSVVTGTIVAVPIANRTAFNAKDRMSPIDHKDLNRQFPGDRSGSYSEHLARALYERTANAADYFVDLHSGRGETYILGYSIYPRTDDDVEDASRELCKAADLPHGIGLKSDDIGGLLFSALAEESIPSVIIETGGEGRLHEEHVRDAATAIENIAFEVGVVSGTQTRTEDISFHRGMEFVKAQTGGYFELKVGGNQSVHAGDTLATISDYRGRTGETIRAPIDGVVVSLRTYGIARPGDQLFELTPPSE